MTGCICKTLLLIALLTSLGLYFLFGPDYVESITLNGQTIKIDRDDNGIATIHVNSIQQLQYAFGTIYAEDRLFQIALRSYSAQGRLSQFLGERPLQFDKLMRELNLKGWAQKRAQRMRIESPQNYTKLSYMVLAINERVSKMPILPIEFHLTGLRWENFTVNHLFYLDILLQWSISMNAVDQYTRSILLSNYTIEQIDWILPNKKEFWAFQSTPIVRDDQIPERLRTENVHDHLERIRFNPLSVERPIALDIIQFQNTIDATNTWAVSGEHTETGLPLLSNDPHLETVIPSQWYQSIINYTTPDGKSIVISSQTNPGNPRVVGKTPYFAIGVSVCHGDNQDLFRERIQGNQYLLDGVWRDLKIRNETIKVKDGSGVREEHYTVRETHRGPIVHYILSFLGSFDLQNDTLSLSWTGFNTQWKDMGLMLDGFLIDNFEDLRQYLQNETQTWANLNLLAITSDNHIIMQQSGLQPIRRNIDSGNYVKDGTTTEHDWVGVVPPQDRMHIFDPPKGYIIHANNRVAEGAYYGGYLNFTTFTARADRIDELLRNQIASGRKIGKEFMKKVLYDTVDVYCRQILPQILGVVEHSRPLLEAFDCNFTSVSTAAAVYEVFMFELYHLMKPFHPEKMSLISFHYMQQGIFNYIHFAHRGDAAKQQTMRKAWGKALAHLEKHFGTKDSTKWEWGKIHVDTNRHAIFRGSALLSKIYDRTTAGWGNFHTPNVAKMEKLQSGNFETTHRANIRLLYGYGKGHVDEWIIDGGASENILSGHYADQLKLLIRNELLPVFGKNGEKAGSNSEL